jgi:predicted nucleotidyltransferase
MDLRALECLVATWAATQPIVKRVYFFGSRVKGTNRLESDLDVAVEIDEDIDDEEPRSAAWARAASKLRTSLAPLLPVILDLQWYGGEAETPTIHAGLVKGHVVVYERICPEQL